MRTRIRRYPFATFYVLAFFLPVLLLGSLLLFPGLYEAVYGGPVDIDATIANAAAEAGVVADNGSSFLTTFVRMCLVEPLLWLIVLGGAAPSIAGLIAALLISGRAGAFDMLRRFRPWSTEQRAAGALRIYGALVATIIIVELAIFGTRYALGGETRAAYTFAVQPLSWTFLSGLFLGAFLDRGGLLEEPGWRAFGLPLLQGRMSSPLAASIALGIAWSLWHLPRDIGFGLIESLGLGPYVILYLPAFTMNCVLVSIVCGYFCNRLGGSVIPAIMVHGLANDALGLSGTSSGVTLTPMHQITIVIPFAVFVGLLIMKTGTNLGLPQTDDTNAANTVGLPRPLAT